MKTLYDSLAESFKILQNTNCFRKPDGIVTGFENLDSMMQGMHKGCLTVLGSRPSLGKTAFALNIVNNLAKGTPATGILFCSDLSSTELSFRLLTIASGVKNCCDSNYQNDELKRLASAVNRLKDYPLYFEEHSGIDDATLENIRTIRAEQKFELLIADNVRPDDCRQLKKLAKELDIAVLALVSLSSKKDKILSRDIADIFVTLHQERKADHDPVLGATVEVTVSKNKHEICGNYRGYFIPEIMLFKESCVREDPFVAIPEIYEPITLYSELKKYLAPENLPLLEHLRSEIPQEGEPLNLSDMLRLSARLEAVGDHENAVKVFFMGRKNCCTYEQGAEVVYDWMFAAMYYWLFRDEYNMHCCMARAEQMLDEHCQREYDELKRRILTYKPSSWIDV